MDSLTLAGAVASLAAFPWLASRSWKTAQKVGKVKAEKIRGLEIAYSPETPEIDICFVHGLTGDARSTWTARSAHTDEEIFWPTKLLNDQTVTKDVSIPQARILLYGYETDVNSLCWLTERTLYHHARHLLEDLTNERKTCKHRPLLFVVHSLGGLLVKSALIFARGLGSTSATEEIEGQDIYLSTFGIVSFGTPHTFAKKQTLCDVVDRLCHARQFVDPTTQVYLPEFEDLNAGTWKEDAKDLESKLNRYNVIALEIPEVFCYESSTTHSFTPLCSEDTAVPVKPRYSERNIIHSLSKGLPIEADHVNMCKFTTQENSDFGNVCRLIQKFYESKPSLQKRRSDLSDTEEASSVGSSGKTRDMGFFVKPDLQPKPPYYQVRRDPTSGEDLLEMLDNRLQNSRFIVLMGDLGHGKTRLALEYAWLQISRGDKSRYSSIFWLDAANEASLEASFKRLVERLDKHYEGVNHKEAEPTSAAPAFFKSFLTRHKERKAAIRRVFDWLAYPENKRWLLIYDDVSDSHASYLQPFLPPKDIHRGYVIMTSKKDHTVRRKNGQDSIHLPRFDPRKAVSGLQRAGRPSFLGSGTIDGMAKGDITDPVTEFQMIRVSSFNRDESVALIKTEQNVDNTAFGAEEDSNPEMYARIAESLSDIPQELDNIKPYLTSADSVQKLKHELEQGIDRFDEVPAEYRPWINMCVMLAYAPIPILLLQLHFKIDREAVRNGLEELERILWARIDYNGTTFRIPEFRRRLRRQALEGFHNGASNAHTACNVVIEAIKHLSVIPQGDPVKISTEQVILKHMNACLDNLARWRTFMGSDCEWDILAEFCETAGLYSEAATFYRSVRGQRITNSNTCSRVSRPCLGMRSDDAYSDHWYDAESSLSVDVGNDERQSLSTDQSDFIDANDDTKASRIMRSELGLIRMQIHLKQFAGLDDQCQEMLQKTESREENRYVRLKIELLRLLLQIKTAKQEWPEAVQGSHNLVEILEQYFGPFAEETVEANCQLAKIHMDQGDYAGAEPLLEQVLMIQQQSSGKDKAHLRTISIHQDLGRTYKEQGKLMQARECYGWLIETYRDLLGEDHIQTARAKEGLAIVMDMMKEYRSADFLYKSALHAAKLLGPESEEYKRLLSNYERMQQTRLSDKRTQQTRPDEKRTQKTRPNNKGSKAFQD